MRYRLIRLFHGDENVNNNFIIEFPVLDNMFLSY